MWELICHHDYRWGTIAADRSPWRSDGHSVGVTPLPGGGLRFTSPQSRVVIARKRDDAWSALGAIRIALVAGAEQGGGTVLHADGSFRLWFEGPYKVVAEVLGVRREFEIGTPPPGHPVNIHIEHDGVNGLSHSYWWEAPAVPAISAGGGKPLFAPGQVPAVGPEGVWIGSAVNDLARHFHGNIFSVQIWRRDPQTMIKTFIRRPMGPRVVDCWVEFTRRFNAAARDNPECAAWLSGALAHVRRDVEFRISQLNREDGEAFRELCVAYQRLWAAGKVASPEMQDLVRRLRDWLKSKRIYSAEDPDLAPIFENPCLETITGATGGLECDADAQTLLRAIIG